MLAVGLPVLPGEGWKPAPGHRPVVGILTMLLIFVGLPFFVLASSSPLLQHWFALKGKGASVYRMYAVSNFGSLLGLLSYPLLVERFLAVGMQAVLWSIGFGLYCSGAVCCALRVKVSPVVAPKRESGVCPKVGLGRITCWLLLSMSTSSLLLSVTNSLCQEVASVPFLWMFPLVLYLLTFIISFGHPRWYHRRELSGPSGCNTGGVGYVDPGDPARSAHAHSLLLLLSICVLYDLPC